MNLFVFAFMLLQVPQKSVPPPIKSCSLEAKASSMNSKGKVTESKECFTSAISARTTANYNWKVIFSTNYKKFHVIDPHNQLTCEAFEIKDTQGFMLVCTTNK